MTSPPDVGLRLSDDQAEQVISQLRMGIPPKGHMRPFTVGRDDELRRLEDRLDEHQATGLLLRANYGSGKTHLLRLIEDMSLARGYAVSFVEVSAQHGIRFNRMDQVAGAVVRNLVLPDGRTGIRGLLQAYEDADDNNSVSASTRRVREELSEGGDWHYSDLLGSDALYLAMRAWHRGGTAETRDFAVEAVSFPDRYKGNSWAVQRELVDPFPSGDLDVDYRLRAATQWSSDEYERAWSLLGGLDRLARMSGLLGVVILFDEIEDVITA